jgi:hypothetical protein
LLDGLNTSDKNGAMEYWGTGHCQFNIPALQHSNSALPLTIRATGAILRCGFCGIVIMKSRNFPKALLTIAAVTVTCLLARDVMAQKGSSDAATISNVAQTAAPAGDAPVQLSYGVPQVLQLSQAKIGESTIVAYIQNSGTIYNLNAPEIIYLKQQGVSDAVITTMLNQRQRVTRAAARTAPPAPAANTTSQPDTAGTSTAVAQPTATYVQTVPSSTVYVIPDTQTYNYDAYYYQPYYYPYYGGWYYPPVTFSFGFGGGYRGGYYHGGWGGYHGYSHHGGGWHH